MRPSRVRSTSERFRGIDDLPRTPCKDAQARPAPASSHASTRRWSRASAIVVADKKPLDRKRSWSDRAQVLDERLIAARILMHGYAPPATGLVLGLVHLEPDAPEARRHKVVAPRHYRAPCMA